VGVKANRAGEGGGGLRVGPHRSGGWLSPAPPRLLGRQPLCLLRQEVLHNTAHMQAGRVRSDIDKVVLAEFRQTRLLRFDHSPVFIESTGDFVEQSLGGGRIVGPEAVQG
jgi:hypothetical protein